MIDSGRTGNLGISIGRELMKVNLVRIGGRFQGDSIGLAIVGTPIRNPQGIKHGFNRPVLITPAGITCVLTDDFHAPFTQPLNIDFDQFPFQIIGHAVSKFFRVKVIDSGLERIAKGEHCVSLCNGIFFGFQLQIVIHSEREAPCNQFLCPALELGIFFAVDPCAENGEIISGNEFVKVNAALIHGNVRNEPVNLKHLFRWLFLNRLNGFGVSFDGGFSGNQRRKGFRAEFAVNFQTLCLLKGFHPGKGLFPEFAVSGSARIAQRVQAGLHFLHVIPGHVGGFQLQDSVTQFPNRGGCGCGLNGFSRGHGITRAQIILQQGFGQVCPISPRTIFHTGFDNAVIETTGFNRIATPDVHAHMTRTEQQDSRHIRQGCNFAVFATLLFAPRKHLACALVRASVGTVLVHELCPALDIIQNTRAAVRPEEALDQTHAIRANLLFLNGFLVFGRSGRTVMFGVLFGFTVQQGRGTDVNTCSVPIGHPQHGQNERHKLRSGKHGLHPLVRGLLVQFRQTRNGSQQGKNSGQKGRAANHDPIHITDHGRCSDGCNSGLGNGLDCADSSRLNPIFEIHFSISPFCLSGRDMKSL